MEKLFQYNENIIRTVSDESGEIWFAGIDICRVLGYKDSQQKIKSLDEDEFKLDRILDGQGKIKDTLTVNESGLYSLVLSSSKPEAKVFKRWVTHEVLPSIRKAGKYGSDTLAQKESQIQEVIKRIDKKEIDVTNKKSEYKDLKSDLSKLNAELKDLLKADPNQLKLFSPEEMKG